MPGIRATGRPRFICFDNITRWTGITTEKRVTWLRIDKRMGKDHSYRGQSLNRGRLKNGPDWNVTLIKNVNFTLFDALGQYTSYADCTAKQFYQNDIDKPS